MTAGHQMFGAFFDPFDWLAGPLRQQAGQRVFLIGRNLDPKGTTHLGLNHLDIVLIHLQGVGQGCAQGMGRLGGDPQGQTFGAVVIMSQGRARFQRRGRMSVQAEGVVQDMVGVGKGLLNITALKTNVHQFIGFPLRVKQGGIWLQSLLGIDHYRQVCVLDFDKIGGLGRGVSGVGHQRGHRRADIMHPVKRQAVDIGRFSPKGAGVQRMGNGPAPLLDIRPGGNNTHAWMLLRRARVDTENPGVGIGTADNGHIAHVRQTHVCGVLSLAGHEFGIQDAADRTADICHAEESLFICVVLEPSAVRFSVSMRFRLILLLRLLCPLLRFNQGVSDSLAEGVSRLRCPVIEPFACFYPKLVLDNFCGEDRRDLL